jgi:Tfp pilus assembly protein FimV
VKTQEKPDRLVAFLLVAFLLVPTGYFLMAVALAPQPHPVAQTTADVETTRPSGAAAYSVKPGDTMWALAGSWTDGARGRETCLARLAAFNPSLDLAGSGAPRLQIGSLVRIPPECPRAQD